MKSAKGKVMKAMKSMKAMKQVKQVKSMKVHELGTSTQTKRMAHFIVKMSKKEKEKMFEQDLCESFSEYEDVKSHSRSFHQPPPCTWIAWVKTDMPERGWLYVKGKATNAESWHLITSTELPYYKV